MAMHLAPALTFIFISIFYLPDNYRAPKWAALFTCLITYFSYYIGKKTHWSFGVFIFYILFYSTFQAVYVLHFPQYTMGDRWGMSTASYGVVLLVFFLSAIKKDSYIILLKSFGAFSLADSFVVILQYILGFDLYGLLGEPSMNGCAISITFPFLILVLRDKYRVLLTIPLIAIALHFSDSSLLLMALSISAYFFAKLKSLKLKVIIPVFVMCAFLGFGYFLKHSGFLNNAPRISGWYQIFDEILRREIYVWGSGNGSYLGNELKIFGLMGLNNRGEFWLHCHSDLLKALFELGLVGIFLFLYPLCVALRNALKSPVLFSSLLSCLAFSLGQYPTRLAVQCFIVCAVLIASIKSINPSE